MEKICNCIKCGRKIKEDESFKIEGYDYKWCMNCIITIILDNQEKSGKNKQSNMCKYEL